MKRYHVPSSEAKDLLMSQLFLAIMECDVNTEQIKKAHHGFKMCLIFSTRSYTPYLFDVRAWLHMVTLTSLHRAWIHGWQTLWTLWLYPIILCDVPT